MEEKNRQDKLLGKVATTLAEIQDADWSVFSQPIGRKLKSLQNKLDQMKKIMENPKENRGFFTEKEIDQTIEKVEHLLNPSEGRGVFVFSLVFLIILLGVYIALHWIFPYKPADNSVTDTFVWVSSPLRYVEILFWSTFGLLTWTVFNAEIMKQKGMDLRQYTTWFAARAIQGIFVAMIVILAVNLIDLGTKFTNTFMPVVAAFILGYYTDRGMEYLELIRDKILPSMIAPKIDLDYPIYSLDATGGVFMSASKNIVICGRVSFDGNKPSPAISLNGTIKVDKEPPANLPIDGNGYFSETLELDEGIHYIKCEVTASNKKTGSEWIRINVYSPTYAVDPAPIYPVDPVAPVDAVDPIAPKDPE
jgi:hypothetical protein